MIDRLTQWWRPRIKLAPGLDSRLRAWRHRPAVDENVALADARVVVVDVETTGLHVRRDRLLSIGAVAIDSGRLHPADGFSAVLKGVESAERENIVIHGIGPQAREAGTEPAEALVAFLEYAGKQPLAAYHAPFDRAMLERALRETLGVRLPNPWLDLAWLAPALAPDAPRPQAGLDAWLEHFGLRAHERHRATADAFVSAELLLILLARARTRGVTTVRALRAMAERHAGMASRGAGW